MAKVLLLIDDSNIHIGTTDIMGPSARFSYPNFEKKYSAENVIVKKYVFGSTLPKNDAFWGFMKDRGYEVTTFERKKSYGGGTREKGVDGAIIARGVAAIKDYHPDIMVLLSGDLDMRGLIQVAKESGCEVHVWSYKKSLAPEIKSACHKCFYIDDELENLIYYKKNDGSEESYRNHRERRRKREEEERERLRQEQERRRQEQEQKQEDGKKLLKSIKIGIGVIAALGAAAAVVKRFLS